MVLNENSPISVAENLLQFIPLPPEVTALHNGGSKVISTLSYIGFACSLDKMAKFTYAVLEFLMMSFPLPLNQSHCISFSQTRLQKWQLCFLLLSIIHIPLLTNTQVVWSLGVLAQSLPTVHQSWTWMTIIYHEGETSHPPKGQLGHHGNTTVLGIHMDTQSA